MQRTKKNKGDKVRNNKLGEEHPQVKKGRDGSSANTKSKPKRGAGNVRTLRKKGKVKKGNVQGVAAQTKLSLNSGFLTESKTRVPPGQEE